MRVPYVDVGDGSGSLTTKLQDLVSASFKDHHSFSEVVDFLQEEEGRTLWAIEREVWGNDPTHQRLMIDNGTTLVNCPPGPEPGDSHGGLLVRTFSDRIAHDETGDENLILSREFKIHDLGPVEGNDHLHRVEIRCDTTRPADENPHQRIIEEERTVIQVVNRDDIF